MAIMVAWSATYTPTTARRISHSAFICSALLSDRPPARRRSLHTAPSAWREAGASLANDEKIKAPRRRFRANLASEGDAITSPCALSNTGASFDSIVLLASSQSNSHWVNERGGADVS